MQRPNIYILPEALIRRLEVIETGLRWAVGDLEEIAGLLDQTKVEYRRRLRADAEFLKALAEMIKPSPKPSVKI